MHKYIVVKNPVSRVYDIIRNEDEIFYDECAFDITESVKREKEKGNDHYQDVWVPNRKINELLKVVYKLHALLPGDGVYVVTDYKTNRCVIAVEWDMDMDMPIQKNVKKNKKSWF
jgi:hypothetical protein